ncbi:unnamed protein product [Larinioides sclopetarius]|uniref:Uncharacterized protein n=1 Tax=Larinioides sclopetarius TaxID=280406 RepID=A0AAV1ZWD4_9ARAC
MVLDSRNVLLGPSKKSASSPKSKWEPLMFELIPVSTNSSGPKESEMFHTESESSSHVGETMMKTRFISCTPW